MNYTHLVFTVYDVKLLFTKEVTDTPYTAWVKIAKKDSTESLDWDKLDESRDFRDFDESIYYFLNEDEEVCVGLNLDEGSYVIEHEYLGERIFKLDPEGNVIERKEVENV